MFMDTFGGFDSFSATFDIVFVVVIGIFLFVVVKGILEWHSNNQAPRLTVDAAVSGKRTHVSHDQHPVGGDISGAQGFTISTTTTYYMTFEVESGDRMEFQVDGTEYGQLAEGDSGRLSFQGTRFLGFERR